MKDLHKLTLTELRRLAAMGRYQMDDVRNFVLTPSEYNAIFIKVHLIEQEIRRRKIVNITPEPLNVTI